MDTSDGQSQQPIAAHHSETTSSLVVPPPAQPEESPKPEPSASQTDPPEPREAHTEPEPRPGRPDDTGEDKPAVGPDGGAVDPQPPACDAENRLWATVEETTADASADREEEEEGVMGG